MSLEPIRVKMRVSETTERVPMRVGESINPQIGTDYALLDNKPQINGVELVDNKTAAELGLATPEDIPTDNAELQNGAGYQTAQQVSAAVAAATEPIQGSVSAIEGKIPAAASTSNKLMDTAAVNAAIAAAVAGIHGISFEVVQTLPASGDTGTIYLVPHSGGVTRNVYDEYIWLGSSWELLGTTEVDLTGYATESWVQSQGYLTQHQDISGKLDKTGDAANTTVSFTQAVSRTAIATGEKLSVLLGKVAKWLADLGTAAFRAATGSITQGSTDLVESGAVYTAVSAKYSKPATGIPKSDLADAVQTSLGKADTALQQHQSLAAYRTAADQDEIDGAQDAVIAGKAPSTAGVYYGKCATAAATQAKTVTVNGTIALEVGVMILVWFQYAQTYNGTPTLNVNGLGAKNIGRVSGANAARYEWSANEVLLMVYDGTRWVIADGALATTSYYGVTKLYTGAVGTSASAALTPISLSNLTRDMVCSAPIYSTSSTYAVGDLVRNYYNVYRCIVAIDTAEAWTEAHWEALPPLLEMLEQGGVQVVTVSGTTPTITALPGVRYVCDECATLDVTLPASGICDVLFTSGSTATVLTVTPPTGVTLRWAGGFDPSSLEADTIYEINVMDGLGVAASVEVSA